MMTLIIPAYSSGPNLQTTIDSCGSICNETIVIATPLYEDDWVRIQEQATKTIRLPWNTVFTHGFGHLYNQGTGLASNDWLLLLGVGETYAEAYREMSHVLNSSPANKVFKCNHVNDPNEWKRIWNRNTGSVNRAPVRWSGLIHEEITGGNADGPPLFRMQDTPKIPNPDPVRQEVFHTVKACSYHHLYRRLRDNPHELGGTNAGWLDFVNGSREANECFLEAHADLIESALDGNLDRFKAIVEARYRKGLLASGVNLNPQGEPMSHE